ncbi:hypothetical protein PENARI_c060G02116 [Penicillium arizonense]|uniref:Uncharacterized protein n=1 Tax=Penicillium arizonense TaxID=1835702 RepID=A0A1F5L1N2_PENAI|nr:hypothetical protein PENARI_c060G02116 [Penicillium arizonense]OGE47133.1 hypothetical protein PENARI_c060G02116 [Penicillium arizonense]
MSAGSLGANAVSRGATTSMPTIKRMANVGVAIGWPLDHARHD